MSARSRPRSRGAVAVATSLMLVAAACGSDSTSTPSTTAAPPATTAQPAATTPSTAASTAAATTVAPATTPGTATSSTGGSSSSTPGSGSATGSSAPAGSAGCPAIDMSVEGDHGKGAGRFTSDITCADSKPLKAAGESIVIGFQNPEGDPNGSFPEYSLAAEATVKYINEELGGLGADIQNGKPGRPVKLEVCKMAISPDDSQRCANELLAKKPALVFSSLNFFGNQIPIYAAAKTPVVVITPITVADFTSPGTYSIGGGGGCLGVHTGLAYYATQDLKGKKIAIPWADTPPGVVCYYDLEAKPMDVLSGKVKGTSKLAGSIPDLTYMGVPIKPATPDITPQVTQVLGFNPDVIMFSGQGADCWNLVNGLGRSGWTQAKIPLVLSSACIDFGAMKAAGDLAKGITFVGSSGTVLNDPATIPDPTGRFEATIYQGKLSKYGMPADQIKKGFAVQGAIGLMSLWELSSQLGVSGQPITGDAVAALYKASNGQHLFGSTPLSCATAPQPYVAVCNAQVSASVWDGTVLKTVKPRFTGVDLVAGTALKPGP